MTAAKAHPAPSSPWASRPALLLEGLVGLAVVVLLIAKDHGGFSTFIFICAAAAVGFTAWMAVRLTSALRDPTLQVADPTDFERDRLEGERDRLLHSIKELELDWAAGKMTEDSYKITRSSAERRALELIRALRVMDERRLERAHSLVTERLGLETKEVSPTALESAAAAPAKAPPEKTSVEVAVALSFDTRPIAFSSAGACAACRYENDADAEFCAGCGRPRKAAA